MANSSFYQASFIGGEWSQSAQGALPDPRYKLSMGTCLNGLPTETGAWCRRPGFKFAAPTRGGAPGKLIPFTFRENAPYNMEFTDGYLRFFNGASLVMTNDAQAVVSISSANPAKVATAVHNWTSGATVMFNSLGTSCPLLHNRPFTITVTSPTEFTLADALTGASIDGSTLGAFVSGNVTRVLEIATTDTSGRWKDLRSVQAEDQTVLLRNDKAPRLLSVLTLPTAQAAATFGLTTFNFRDGPYLDPISGSILTASALNGTVTITLSTQAYDSTKAYNAGDFVTTGGITYKSLADNNQNHTPSASPTYWQATTAGAAVGPNGFVASDIGRLIRMYSEPPLYAAGSAYSAGQTVSMPSTIAGINTYYTATGSIPANNPPGTSLLWSITPTVARWTWGRVQSVSGTGLITPVSAFGLLCNNASGAFNGTTGQPLVSSANFSSPVDTAPVWSYLSDYNHATLVYFQGLIYRCLQDHRYYSGFLVDPGGIVISSGSYWRCIKRNLQNGQFVAPQEGEFWTGYGGGQPTNQVVWEFVEVAPVPMLDMAVGQTYGAGKAISQATVYPTSDIGFANSGASITLNLRAKNSTPSVASDGVLLGTSGPFANTFAPVTINSNDPVTAYTNVWVELVSTWVLPLPSTGNQFLVNAGISQIQFYQPNVNNGSVITVQIEGSPLLYLSAITTWRLGVYSDTTGYPTCGVYHEGRLWLSGAIDNRVDASRAGKINDFAPTSDYGAVSDDNGISYTLDATDVNAVFWMAQDQQGIICGTQAGEWLIQASTLNSPLTPTNMQAHRVTTIGCANIEPRRSDHTLLFVQKHGRKVMEYFADVFSGKFSSPNLMKDAKHLSVGGIAEIAWQQELVPTLWARRNDGQLIGMTYKRDSLTTSQGPTANGWHHHTLGSGRLVESLCVGPSVDGTLDSVSLITNDPVTGIRHVEVGTDLFEETNLITDAWQVDDAVSASSYSVGTVAGGAPGVTFTGLWHLNGKSVAVFAGGLDLGDWPVSNGAVQVPFAPATAATNALFTSAFVAGFGSSMPTAIGFSFTSQGQLLPPDTQPESGARNGPGFAKIRRMHKFGASLVATQGISFGTSFNRLHPALLKTPGGTALLASNVLYSGTIKDTIADDAEGYASQLCWQISRPFPAMVAGAGGFIQTTDE